MPRTPATTTRMTAFAATALMLVACSGGKTTGQPGVANPERQSDAEYDLARESFQKGDSRTALDHIQKAVEYNEDNDKAHYLHAAILLSFCAGPREFEARAASS